MKDLPSKADMEEAGIALRERAGAEGQEGYFAFAVKLRGVADFLESLAAKKEEPVNVAEYLNGRSVMIRTHADGEQRLFNSVGQEEVAIAIKQEHSIHLSPDQILMGWPIRELGVFNVGLRLEGDPTIKVWIVQDAQEAVGQPEQHEEPKVESLRDAADRLHCKPNRYHNQDAADLCAIGLGRVDRLADLVLLHCERNTELGAQRDALRRLRTEIAQMREGCEE